MDTDNTFTGWCCSLVSGETEIAGTLVDLAELKLPSDKEQLHKQLPGLSMRVDNIITTYVLITSHSVLPGSTCLEEWKFSEKFLGRQAAEKTLDVFVSGVLSCCGPKSFVIGSDTTVNEHHHKDCSLGLNFTMLFFNEDFQQHYCAHFGTEVNPPAMTLSQCEADIEWIDQCLSTAKNNVPENALAPRARVVSFIVINASCIEVAIESASKRKEQSLPDLQLYKEITKFDRVKSVQCKSSESSCHPLFVEGMALVCRSDANNDSLKLIGVLTGHGKALILSALLQLLKGIAIFNVYLHVYF